MRSVGRLAAHDDPGGPSTEADELALVCGARRAPNRAEVDRFEQVRLPGSVGPRDDGQPSTQRRLRILVAAEVAKREAQPQVALTITFMRKGRVPCTAGYCRSAQAATCTGWLGYANGRATST